ncbi:MAG TPA: hypothetical protein VFC07_06690, partial [Verrucomicrobiae bacterium]|nr:hypothetical protein [Verrucomicrobiae bacterium]
MVQQIFNPFGVWILTYNVQVIQSDSELSGLVKRLGAAPWIALDTEADSLHAYPEKLCLLQISIPGA